MWTGPLEFSRSISSSELTTWLSMLSVAGVMVMIGLSFDGGSAVLAATFELFSELLDSRSLTQQEKDGTGCWSAGHLEEFLIASCLMQLAR